MYWSEAKRHPNLQKWSEPLVFFNILTSKCASRHNGVHFFDIATSKSGPTLRWLYRFWLRNVLRATTACTFSTSQKWSDTEVFYAFWLRYVLRCGVHFFDIATSKSVPTLRCLLHFDFEMCFAPQRRALFRHLNFQKWSGAGVFCTFWLRNVLRATTACNFSPLIWASWLRTRRFSEPTFRPSGATNDWKNIRCFATFLPFRASASSFFWLFLFYSSLF